ncbi:hypothetical protein IWW38_005563 [Coemansia aciculifera]|uniref:Uncharacterized protein n=1 Tax=Coemansia aciculifera TaxID=417176 RepID=A0ACC1LUD5_9FUNG|nr:hypothetical protein IWW38_005563 [Coemansia aciculifera]
MRRQVVLYLAAACLAVSAVRAQADIRGFNLAVAAAAAAPSANQPQPQHGGGDNKEAHADKPKEAAPKATKTQDPPHDSGKGGGGGGGPKNIHAPAAIIKGAKKEADKKPSKTSKHGDSDEDDDIDEDVEKEYMKRVKADKDAGKMPGRMKMIVPPRTVHTPLFELDSVVELRWEYDNNVIEIPEKLMISVQLPKDPHGDPGAKPVLYDIAVNITGSKKRFYWDTKNDVPEGVGMREGNGYIMYFYDGDIGFRMSDVVPARYLIKYAMPFAFYISRYERTNDGVPRGYNPNDAGRLAPPATGRLLALLLIVSTAALHLRRPSNYH